MIKTQRKKWTVQSKAVYSTHENAMRLLTIYLTVQEIKKNCDNTYFFHPILPNGIHTVIENNT